MSSLKAYTAKQVPYIWRAVRGHIQSALDRGSNYTLEDIYKGLLKKEMQLWVWQSDGCKRKIYAALVTAIQTNKDIKYCLYLALGGSRMDEWADCMKVVEDWARQHGCTEMRIYGRLGWKKLGFEFEYAKLTRKIDE